MKNSASGKLTTTAPNKVPKIRKEYMETIYDGLKSQMNNMLEQQLS